MIPKISEPEWADLIEGKIDPELSSFSLKMKVNSVRQGYKAGVFSLDHAIKDLHALCVKYEKIYVEDLNKIFKNITISL